MVELVLEPEVRNRLPDAFGTLGSAQLREREDVAAGAERSFACAFEDYYVGELGFLPFLVGGSVVQQAGRLAG